MPERPPKIDLGPWEEKLLKLPDNVVLVIS